MDRWLVHASLLQASEREIYTTLRDFGGGIRDLGEELLFRKGEQVEVLERQGGWWRGKKQIEGWFPMSYVDAGDLLLMDTQGKLAVAAGEAAPSVKGIIFCPFEDWLT